MTTFKRNNMTTCPPAPVFRKIWGRRQARPLKAYHKELMTHLLPTLSRSVYPGFPFDVTGKTWLEIGFGGGEHLVFQAKANPHITILGCEPFVNGVASLLTHIDEEKLSNIQIVMDDARLLMAALPDRCLDRIFILFPDPWPKKRHQKRRIVGPETLHDISRILSRGGALYMATDCSDYAQWMQEVLSHFPNFTLDLEERSTIYDRPEGWPKTRYEEKGCLAGRKSAYMIYRHTPNL